jgi:hypothetical protein
MRSAVALVAVENEVGCGDDTRGQPWWRRQMRHGMVEAARVEVAHEVRRDGGGPGSRQHTRLAASAHEAGHGGGRSWAGW